MQRITPVLEDEDKVQLKPILGIRPGVYLSALYGLFILIIFFFVCLFPGLSRPGSILSISTRPQGAAIRIDGLNRGSSPDRIFVEKGLHRVELVLPGFESRQLELEVPGRAAFSLFFPRRVMVEETLNTGAPLAVISAAAADYTGWSFTGEATAAYQLPLSLSEGVYRAAPLLKGEQIAEAQELIPAAARFAVSQASLRDLGRAKMLLDNGGLAPSPLSLTQSAGDILAWLSSSPEAAPWLVTVLPAEAAARVKNSPWYAQTAEGGGTSAGAGGYSVAAGLPAYLQVAGLRFRRVDAGKAGTGNFYAAESPVSTTAWETFVQARPEWALENSGQLREQGLVNSDYLITLDNAGQGAAQTAVSWHAALAFCQWLGEQLPPGFEAWEIRLPSETEWEYALEAQNNALEANFWEWCADPYAPLASFPASPRAVQAVGSPERVLRGRAEARASLPPHFCSPFTGFRPFIMLRASGTE
jgi:formylglycine-generating enzyme required for sulfatase activity